MVVIKGCPQIYANLPASYHLPRVMARVIDVHRGEWRRDGKFYKNYNLNLSNFRLKFHENLRDRRHPFFWSYCSTCKIGFNGAGTHGRSQMGVLKPPNQTDRYSYRAPNKPFTVYYLGYNSHRVHTCLDIKKKMLSTDNIFCCCNNDTKPEQLSLQRDTLPICLLILSDSNECLIIN